MAKQCVTQEAKAGCGIGQYINRDMFNPFCPYNTDPPLDTAGKTMNLLSLEGATFLLIYLFI